jgi:hypothetical protein
MKKLILSLIVFCSGSSIVFAQTTRINKDSLRNGTIENQFEYISIVSDNYNQFEVVEVKNLERLKKNVLDSLNILRSQYEALKSEVGGNSESIKLITGKLDQAILEKEEAISTKESINFFGLSLYKSVFAGIMWFLVIGLGVFLFVILTRYKSSFGRVKEAEKALVDVQEEFERHRRNTLERERKMKRELIDAQMGKSKP